MNLISFRTLVLSLFFLALTFSCATKKEFTGFSYDPPEVTNTVDKEISLPVKNISLFPDIGFAIDTDFSAARLSHIEPLDSTTYALHIKPENAPINNSPWYAFRMRSEHPNWYTFRLTYEHGWHRYYPKFSNDGVTFYPLAEENVLYTKNPFSFRIYLNEDPVWIAGQELRTYQNMQQWTDSLATDTLVSKRSIGNSTLGRALPVLHIGNTTSPDFRVVIVGRQHPPEVTGDLFLEDFIFALSDTSLIDSTFFKRAEVIVFPMLNPDGVELGHWRHNASGVDLNRDWNQFNQVETRRVTQYLKALEPSAPIVYSIDIHSTSITLFYPILRRLLSESNAIPITDDWRNSILDTLPDVRIKTEAFDTDAPIFKNYMFKTFGCDGVTYELSDRFNRQQIDDLARVSAQTLTRLLIQKFPAMK